MAQFSQSDLSKYNCMLKDSMGVSAQRSTNQTGLGTYLYSSGSVSEKGCVVKD